VENNQRGAALIMALFITALVAAAAVAMIDRLHVDIRRTELILATTRANFLAQGSIMWAIDQLNNDWLLQQPQKIVDRMPITSPTNHVGDAEISSVITDAQGYFNINNIINPALRYDFIHLLNLIAPELTPEQAQEIMFAVADWISPSSNSNKDFNQYYNKLNPSYRVPHRLMTSVSELRLVKGITPRLFAKLSPYLIALPQETPLNINSASTLVLATLSPALTLDTAKSMMSFRQSTPFLTTQSFLNMDLIKNSNIAESKITVKSTYFLVKTNVKVGEQITTLYTLLQRAVTDTKPHELILWQSKGTL